MGYFDLNIPYMEESQPTNPSEPSKNTTTVRLKIVVKAMELGYTGIAYNRSIKGVTSNKDICTIPHFPLPSLLKLNPNLSTSVQFHRELLGVRVNSPFRQYTRLTVSVDSLIQCSGLNSGNSVLKSYDLVAVRPLNQVTFEYACKSAQVDLIAIDFTAWLPFQIKFQSLQTAIKRGVYFEITYSHLLSDVQIRKQMVHTTKLLVQWTRGKNLIFSSSAASVTDIRGPCDVANLSSVLGVSMERAKAALSKNCRSLLLNAVRKKHYKNAVKVERISPKKSMDSNEAWFCDGNDWDHLSSGEGDLLLDDIAKCFAASSKVPMTSKSIDFASVSKEMPSLGMQLMNWLPGSAGNMHPPENLCAAKEFGSSSDTVQAKQMCKLRVDPIAGGVSSDSTPLKHQLSRGQGFLKSVSAKDVPPILPDGKELDTLATCFEGGKGSDGAVEVLTHGKASEDCGHECVLVTPTKDIQVRAILLDGKELDTLATCFEGGKGSDGTVEVMTHGKTSEDCGLECVLVTPKKDIQASEHQADAQESSVLDIVSSSLDHISTIENNIVDTIDTSIHITTSEDVAPSYSCMGDDTSLNYLDVVLDARDTRMVGVLSEKEEKENANAILAGCNMSIDKEYANGEKHGQYKYHAFLPADDKLLGESFSEMQADANCRFEFILSEGASVEPDDRKQLKSGSPCKKSKRNIWGDWIDPNMKELFMELCLHELENGGRSGETLTPSSWTRIEEEFKKEFERSCTKKQLRKSLVFMKKQYHICVNLTSKIGHSYNAARNTIDWSLETREGYQKTRVEAKQFCHNPLQYADDLASLFDSVAETGEFNQGPHKDGLPMDIDVPSILQSQVCMEEPGDLKSDNLTPRTLHSESLPSSELTLQREEDVIIRGKCHKRRRTVLSQTSKQGSLVETQN